MSNKFTVIGYYLDNGQRYCGLGIGETWVEAVQFCISEVGRSSSLVIVEVIEGEHDGLTEGEYVEEVRDFPMDDADADVEETETAEA